MHSNETADQVALVMPRIEGRSSVRPRWKRRNCVFGQSGLDGQNPCNDCTFTLRTGMSHRYATSEPVAILVVLHETLREIGEAKRFLRTPLICQVKNLGFCSEI